jgi:branched-chain amino acid transport system substrate-binding protein
LTNTSGFSGIDGIFRFRPDGTNERGLAVLRVAPGGGQVISPAPKAFAGSGT